MSGIKRDISLSPLVYISILLVRNASQEEDSTLKM